MVVTSDILVNPELFEGEAAQALQGFKGDFDRFVAAAHPGIPSDEVNDSIHAERLPFAGMWARVRAEARDRGDRDR